MSVETRLKNAEAQTNLNPTEKQKMTGNYRKGRITIKGFSISIENPRGSVREGIDELGKKWSIEAKNTYGYFNRTTGKDNDGIDVYLGPNLDANFNVYVIDQINVNTRQFDEHKVMFGFMSADEAKAAYNSNFEDGWQGFGGMVSLTMDNFRNWLYNAQWAQQPIGKLKHRLVDKKIINQGSDGMCLVKMQCVVEEGKTLKDLQSQIKGPFNTLVLEIGSPGGNVSEGIRIMQWLDELSQEGIHVITVVSANAYSIASLIALVANQRYISVHGKIMVHNPMIPEIVYANAEELEQNARELRELEDLLIDLYVMFTGIESAKIRELMNQETYLDPDMAVELGFADEIINIEKKPYISADNSITHKIKNMSNVLNKLRAIAAKIDGKALVNQIYSTPDGEIEIYQADPSTYAIGDRTNVKEGTVEISDGSKLVIKDYLIDDIITEIPEPQEPATPAEPAEPIAPVEPMAADGDFNTGPAPKAVEPGFEIEIEPIEPAEPVMPVAPMAPAAPVAPAVEPNPAKEQLIAQVQEMQNTISKMAKELSELKAEKMQDQIAKMSQSISTIENRLVEIDKFEGAATEAIESIALHTEAVWKPSAKAQAKVETGGSIFQRAKAARGVQ